MKKKNAKKSRDTASLSETNYCFEICQDVIFKVVKHSKPLLYLGVTFFAKVNLFNEYKMLSLLIPIMNLFKTKKSDLRRVASITAILGSKNEKIRENCRNGTKKRLK